MKKVSSILSCAMLAGLAASAIAQDTDTTAAKIAAINEEISTVSGKVNAMEEDYLATKATVDKLAKIKFSGYTQIQYRMALGYDDATDTAAARLGTGKASSYHKYNYAVGDFAGGSFSEGVGSMLQVRRARFKLSYETPLTQSVIQLDVLPFTNVTLAEKISLDSAGSSRNDTTSWSSVKSVAKLTPTTKPALTGGGVTLKDAYIRFTDPILKTFSLKTGIYDRPFGFEIGYSSSSRETPERSRTEQTLFPGERDLGVSLEILPSEMLPSVLQMFNSKIAMLSGNGINIENDDFRDICGRFGFSIPLTNINLSIDGGISGYEGYVKSYTDDAYTFNKDSKAFVKSTGNLNKGMLREYAGADLQVYYDLPVVGGFSVRGEVYKGTQPADVGNSSSPKSNIAQSKAIYSRQFIGGYGALIQNLNPINSQLVVRYDVYDPNTDFKGADIDSLYLATKGATAATVGDIAYGTLGLGLVYHWDENIKFTLYYEMPKSETVSAKLVKNKDFFGFTKEQNLDVLTFRVQYKF